MKKHTGIDVKTSGKNKNRCLFGRIAALALTALAAGFVMTGIKTNAAESDLTAAEYITDIQIVSGNSSEEAAAESGRKVMSDRIGGSMISYRTGNSAGSALKGLRLMKSGGATETIDDITYQQLGSIGGYNLYGTTDSSAGGAILALRVTDDLFTGDGSHFVRDEKGEVVELGGDKYLTTIHAGQVGRYVGDVAKVKGNSEKAAIRKALNQGYDYYRLVSEDDGVVLIAYNRTNDEDNAARAVYAVGDEEDFKIFYSKSPAAGAPIAEIELKEISDIIWEGSSFTLGDWAQMYFGTGTIGDSVSYIIQDDIYRELTGSTDVYVWNPISLFADKAELGQALTDRSESGNTIGIVVAQEEGKTGGDGDIELAGVDMEKFLSGLDDEEEEAEEAEEEAEEENPEEMQEGDELMNEDGEFGASDTPVEAPAYEDVTEEGSAGDSEVASAEESGSDESAPEAEEGNAAEEASETGSMVGSGKKIMIAVGAGILVCILIGGLIERKRLRGSSDDGKTGGGL